MSCKQSQVIILRNMKKRLIAKISVSNSCQKPIIVSTYIGSRTLFDKMIFDCISLGHFKMHNYPALYSRSLHQFTDDRGGGRPAGKLRKRHACADTRLERRAQEPTWLDHQLELTLQGANRTAAVAVRNGYNTINTMRTGTAWHAARYTKARGIVRYRRPNSIIEKKSIFSKR